MSFTLLPALDVAGGRAVREGGAQTGSGGTLSDPLAIALAWQVEGAEWIHLVDLDAAFGRGSNAELLGAVIGALDSKVELSGGIRDEASLRTALATGCARVNVSTEALGDAAWCRRALAEHGDRIAMSLDARAVEAADGATTFRLLARGLGADGGELGPVLEQLEQFGCSRYVVTDVARDGRLAGPNVALYRTVEAVVEAPLIASGGVSSLQDLVVLAEAASAGHGLEGSIVGTALHAGRFTLREALQTVGAFG